MRCKVLTILLCCAAIAAEAVEIPFRSGAWSGTLESRGAVLKTLTFKGKRLTAAGNNTFEDYVLGNGGGKVELCEDFFKLEFEPIRVRANQAAFTACGTGAFADLRVTKTYVFDSRKPEFSVTWEYKNIGTKPLSAGLRTRCFFRNDSDKASTFYFPENGKVVKADYPGATLTDRWILNPGLAWVAVHGKSDKSGLVLLPPRDLLGSLFCYFSRAKVLNTQEFFLNDQVVAPGKSVSFTLRGKHISGPPAGADAPVNFKITALKGGKLRFPLLYAGKKGAVLVNYANAKAEKHLDLFPERQLDESFRTLELPEGTDAENISLWELANKSAVPDRPVPFKVFKDAAGKQILKFRVPGVYPLMGGGVVWRNGAAWESSGRRYFLGFAQYPCRLLFRKGGKVDPTIPDGPAELIHNGDFSKPYAADPTIPEGYRSQFVYDRNNKDNNFSFLKPGIRIVWNAKARPQTGAICITTRVERGIKYNFTTKLSCTNPLGNWVVVSIGFYDAANKQLHRSLNIYQHSAKKPMPLAVRSKTFYPPAGAARAEIYLRLYDHRQEMKIYNVSLSPEPYRAGVRSPEEILRNELVSGYVPALDLIEKLDFSTVTPHRKFFPDPAARFPKLLYLTGNSGEYIAKQAHRRHLLELCQRAKFDFTYIPLLRKIASGRGSAWDFQFADTLEPYTLMRLRNLKEKPEAVMINEADFDYIPQETRDQLKALRKGGVPLIFFNCRKIPAELLGKSVPLPEHILGTLPRMRVLRPQLVERHLRFCSSGEGALSAVWNTGTFEYLQARFLPFIPAERAAEMVPNVYGFDFPYWEYFYLAQLKVLRYVSKHEGPVVVRKAEPGALTLQSAADCKVKIASVVRDYYGRLVGQAESTAVLKKGLNTVVPPMPAKPLTGGISVVDLKICNEGGKELDWGAFKVDTPALPLKVDMGGIEPVFSRSKPVTFTVESLPGAVYECEIVDTEGRSVWYRKGTQTRFAAQLSFPFTRLYNLFVRAEAGKRSALLRKEFAVESAPIDPLDVDAVIWMNRPAYSRLVRDLGFNLNFTNFGQTHMQAGSLRAMVTDGVEPVSFGSGRALNPNPRTYRHDVETDPVRKPCLSDPAQKAKAEKLLLKELNYFHARYYGVRRHIAADEADLGRSVCFSEHCLKAFRVWLKERYKGSLAELNKCWDTSFKKWDEVVPVQFKELRNRERMARYLEHKLFMNLVFARDWVGATGAGINKGMPGAVYGLSGTQDPGFSYDWVQMMKYNPFLMYYGGNQVNAVLDFAPEGSQHGQWLGYTRGFKLNEVFTKGRIWLDIFRGANLICKYSCEAFRGDVTARPNAKFFSEAVREVRSGIGSRLLHTKELGRDVGILYSQLSLLCAFSNSVGRQNILNIWSSWPALLTDLGVRYRMISYETLEKQPPECKVLILPGAFSLSGAQLANLKKFVEKGGCLIADCGAGWYDGHGNRAADKLAEKLFGIDRNQAVLYPADAPAYRTMPLGETGLKLAGGGKAAFRAGSEPVVITKKHGRGEAVLLNLAVGSYYTIQLGGAGGEEAAEKGGAAGMQKSLREIVSPFVCSRCKPPFEVKGVTGATIFLRRDGKNHYAGVLPRIVDVPLYKDLKPIPVELKFPVKGHLYLMREGKYLGFSDSCKLTVRGGDPALIAILPEKVKPPVIEAPEKVKAGEVCTIRCSAPGGAGAHVFHVELRRPDGARPFGYWWNDYASKGERKFQFARNDLPGRWSIVVRDVDTGMSSTRPLLLEK